MDRIYEGKRVIQERDGSNVPTVSYTRGPDLSGSLEGAGGIGGLLARSHGYASTNGNWYTHNSYHADGNGNITYLVNSSQGLGASYKYDPYGNTLSASGTLRFANVYRFSSKEIHPYSGMYYYGYRWYVPNLQRWLNRDPLGESGFEVLRKHKALKERFPSRRLAEILQGPNLYGFVRNSPSIFVDKLGLYNPVIGPDGKVVSGGDGLPDPTIFFPQLPPATPPPPSLCPGFAGGLDVHLSWVNPATSGGGGIIGFNQMTFFNDNTTRDYVYGGTGLGLDVAVSVQSVWARGSGDWTGTFHGVAANHGPLGGSLFWTPGRGGWFGFTFGIGFGYGGALEETEFYELRKHGD